MQELTDIISCVLLMHTKKNSSGNYNEISGGSYKVPLNSTRKALFSLNVTANFVGRWLQALEQYFLERCNMYFML